MPEVIQQWICERPEEILEGGSSGKRSSVNFRPLMTNCQGFERLTLPSLSKPAYTLPLLSAGCVGRHVAVLSEESRASFAAAPCRWLEGNQELRVG
jgi:hypothetical protein